MEQVLEIQEEVYLCFIDYTKAIDRALLEEIITQLTQLKIDGKKYADHEIHLLIADNNNAS